jgi:hypothetical protein
LALLICPPQYECLVAGCDARFASDKDREKHLIDLHHYPRGTLLLLLLLVLSLLPVEGCACATSRPLAIPYLVVGPPASLPPLLHAEFAFHYRRRKRYIRRKKGKRDKSKDTNKQTQEEQQQRYD